MSEENIVNDWIDADKLRQTAEGLLKPVDKTNAEEKSAATFSDDFVGFAEGSKAASASPAAPVVSQPPVPASVQPPVAVAPVVTTASKVAEVSLPAVAAFRPTFPKVRAAVINRSRLSYNISAVTAAKGFETPFQIVLTPLSKEELAKLPRSL